MERPQNISSSREGSPPWMQGAKEIDKVEMLVVHMNNGELEGLDNLQGGPSLDPETGIREYSALASIIEIPEIRQLFFHVYDEIEKNGDISPDLRKIYQFAKKDSPNPPYKPTPEEKHDPLHAIEKTGRGGDTKLALIPLNLAFLLIELRHEPSINPKTGLLEFVPPSWSSNSSNSWQSKYNYQPSFSNDFKSFNPSSNNYTRNDYAWNSNSGQRSFSPPSFLNKFSSSNNAWNSSPSSHHPYNNDNAWNYSHHTGNNNNTWNSPSPSFGNRSVSSPSSNKNGLFDFPHADKYSFSKEPLQKIGAIGGDIVKKIYNFLSENNYENLLKAGTLGFSYMGSQKHHKQQKKEYEEKKKEEREKEEANEEQKRKSGFYDPWKEPPFKERRYNPRWNRASDLEKKYGVFSEPLFEDEEKEKGYAKGGSIKSYRQGTLVRGPGKGQDDKIKTSVPEGSYIIDASSTSMFGDGSTKAGSESLREFENFIKNKVPKGILQEVKKHMDKNTPQLPVWLSEGEYKIDPTTVTLLGKGSNDKGAALLKEMVIKLRKHKISKGSGLPPKAKSPAYYIDS